MQEKKQTKRKLSRRDFVKTTAVGLGATALSAMGAVPAEASTGGSSVPKRWDHEADLVVVGAGASGLSAAIEAFENGASVIVVEANPDVGGKAIISGGGVSLGGGTTRQQKYGIKDSPDLLYSDLTDWSVLEVNGFPDYRYNDREIMRAFADNSVSTYDWLVAHGVVFVEKAPDNGGANATGNSVPRENHVAPMRWPQLQTGVPVPADLATTLSSGVGFIRPLEASARKLGVQILLEHRMTTLVRENPTSGRVLGITATNNGKTLNIRARKGVFVGTGGHTGNVNFRRIFDPRLTEEYQLLGAPWVLADASGELAAMAIGASLWGTYNQTAEFGEILFKAGRVGTQYGWIGLGWKPGSPVFPRARSIGLAVRDWQNVILVNHAGRRFYDETKGGGYGYPQANHGSAVEPYTPWSYRNLNSVKFDPEPFSFNNAALAGVVEEATNGGGPVWAIFDADAVKRESWNTTPPDVDIAAGFFFSANTIEELARKIVMKYQRKPMPPDTLQDTVTKYNSFVDAGNDPDFGKPAPRYKIQTPPFYAGWATSIVHDSRAGLRITAKGEVVDLNGNVIPGLYSGGESAGGFSQHGLARASVQGRIAGRGIVQSEPSSSGKS